MCIECWEDNCSFANITSKATLESDYEARSNITPIICHESNEKWRNLLSKFHGKRVKNTIEEFPKHEGVTSKQWIYDELTEWLEVKLK